MENQRRVRPQTNSAIAPAKIDGWGPNPSMGSRCTAAKAPPMLLIHGQDDTLVYPKNSVNLAAKVNAAGGHAEVVVLPKTGHVTTLFQAGRGLRGLTWESSKTGFFCY